MRIALADTVRRVRPLAPLRPFVPDPDRADVWWDPSAQATNPAALEFTSDDFAASLAEWVEATQPPIWHGHAPPPGSPEIESGRVVGVIRLTEAEARDRGIESQSGDWLYAECACLPGLAELVDSQQLRGTSPGLQANYTDDEGRVWPVILRELSFVMQPRLRTQPRAAEIDAANLGDAMPAPKFARRLHAAKTVTVAKRDGTVLYEGAPLSCRMQDLPASEPITVAEAGETIAVTTPEEYGAAMACEPAKMEDASDLAEVLAAALDTLPEAAKEHARALLDILAGTAAAAGAVAEMADGGEVAKLRREVARLRAEREVDADLAGRVVPPGVTRERLLECRMRDADAYQIALSALPARPKLATERINLSDAKPVTGTPEQASAAALTIAAARAAAKGEAFSPVDFARFGGH